MTRSQSYLLAGLFLCAVIVRLVSLPTVPFFCDAPSNVLAIESGTMRIQFPGYVPFHLLIKLISLLTGGSVFAAIVLFSFLCGLAAIIYVALFAYDRAGFPGALLAGTLMAFSPNSIYFSCVGTSYTTDVLAISALIYHGNRALAKGSDRDYKAAVSWFIFGCVMRTLSFPFTGLAVLFLLWKLPTRANVIFTVAVSVLGGVIYGGLTFFYFGSLSAIAASSGPATNLVTFHPTLLWFEGNETRNILYLAWGLNVFVFAIIASLWLTRKNINPNLGIFFSLLIVPYLLFLLWYICHAGYACLLLPPFICLPWIADKAGWINSKAAPLAAGMAIIFLFEFFALKPIAFTGKYSLIANGYCLLYTQAGIKACMFGSLRQLGGRYHILVPQTLGKDQHAPP